MSTTTKNNLLNVYVCGELPVFMSLPNFVQETKDINTADVVLTNLGKDIGDTVEKSAHSAVYILLKGTGSDTASITKTLFDIYYGFKHESCINYLINATPTTSLIRLLKGIELFPGRTHYSDFYSKFTDNNLLPLRKKYTNEMTSLLKSTIEDHGASYTSFITGYAGIDIDQIDISGAGIWSPEMIYAYVTKYMLWDIPQLTKLYEEYEELKTGDYLRECLIEYYHTIPEKKYVKSLVDQLLIIFSIFE